MLELDCSRNSPICLSRSLHCLFRVVFFLFSLLFCSCGFFSFFLSMKFTTVNCIFYSTFNIKQATYNFFLSFHVYRSLLCACVCMCVRERWALTTKSTHLAANVSYVNWVHFSHAFCKIIHDTSVQCLIFTYIIWSKSLSYRFKAQKK